MSFPSASVILVDGSSYLFRAYHALPPLTTSKGQPTGAIRGVISMLRALCQDYPEALVVVVFDAKGKTFRKDLYPEYKANRPPMPSELSAQIEPLHQLVQAMGLPLLVVEGVEADDVLGTLAMEAMSLGHSVVISTGDKDMAQLVCDQVYLMDTMKNTTLDPEGVKAKYGVPPEQIVDFLALVGDSSDNIPGVTKCGPKTAAKWLESYGSLEAVMANAAQVKGKIGEYLQEALAHLPLSKTLATIVTDVPLPVQWHDLKREAPNKAKLCELYETLEFKTWLPEVTDGVSLATTEMSACHYELVTTQAQLDAWVERCRQAPWVALDTETTSLNYKDARLVGLSLCVSPEAAAYIALGHDDELIEQQLAIDTVLQALQPILSDTQKPKVGQHIKYDLHVLANHGASVAGLLYDTMLESYVLDSVATRHDLDHLSQFYLNRATTSFEDVAGKGVKQKTFNQIPLDQAVPYACEDAEVTFALHQTLWPRLSVEPKLKQLYLEIEQPLIRVLQKMEFMGVKIDAERLAVQSEQLTEALAGLEEQAFVLAGQSFNINSPKQLQMILYEIMGLPVVKKTPKGQPSTAEAVLQDLALDFELPAVILQYRSLSKLKSTYTEPLPTLIHPLSGRVHTSYHQAVTATGRLSSSHPNLQNIPIRTPEGRKIRQAFIAEQGYSLISADYSQIELRIMAHLSGDPGLLDAFAQDRDVHRATAAEVFDVAVSEVTGDQRRQAKAINFGLIYGMSAFGLSRQLGLSRQAAQAYIDRYFERYPGVLAYMERTREQAAHLGYVETLFGRRLYLPDIRANQALRRQAAERTAINAPMQGTAADIIKCAMIAVDQWLVRERLDARLLMQVHDELVVEVADSQLKQVQVGLLATMSDAAQLVVPLVVDAGVGKNWGDAHGL